MSKLDKILNLLGTKIGNWKLLSISNRNKNEKVCVKCECCCGNVKDVDIYNLLNNVTKSCGCQRIKDQSLDAKNQVLARYRKQAKEKNVSWELTNQEAIKFFSENCYYCNSKPG